jgi:hypothetical protein
MTNLAGATPPQTVRFLLNATTELCQIANETPEIANELRRIADELEAEAAQHTKDR